MHRIENEFQVCIAKPLPVHKFFERIEIRRARLDGMNQVRTRRKRRHPFFQDAGEFLFDFRHDRWQSAAAVARLVLHSVPAIGIVTRRDDNAADRFLVPHQKRNRRRGARLVRNPHRGPRCADNFGDRSGEAIGGIAVVVTDDHAFARVFAANHIARNRVRHNARVCKREIICNDAAPSVRAKLDRGSHE